MDDDELCQRLLDLGIYSPKAAAERIATLRAERDALAKCVEAADKIVAMFEPAIAEARAEGERIGRERERAEIVAQVRADAQLCDCHARSEGECACGAWSDCKRVDVEQIAAMIEAGNL